MRKQTWLLLTAFLTCFGATAQTADPAAAISRIHQLFLQDYNYLKPIDSLKGSATAYRHNEDLLGMYFQAPATYESFTGNYAAAISAYNNMFPQNDYDAGNTEKAKPAFNGYTPVNAAEKIGALAAQHRVIMINESHHTPYHRLFTKSLLPALYKKGFRYLALETLEYKDAALNKRGYPIQGDGFYSTEPLFGDLIRTAISIGFKVISYEDTTTCREGDCYQQRETMEARNLCKILREDTAARILVHAGYDHIFEKEKYNLRRMAMCFRECSGINPLTINQESMCEKGNPANENSYYTAAATLYHISASTVFEKKDSIWVEPRLAGYVDMEVFHPRFTDKYNRPGYFLLDPTRIPSPVSLKKEYTNMLVQAYMDNESGNSIPVDQQVYSGTSPLYLMLPKGKFRIVVKDHLNKIISTAAYSN
ncbi:hypothetical protein ECE50_017635 [Chitinophaga sp. Mgbs1]|uniref:Uncharacterized protein n=1 Tax=Chitinophaga solisilvae TaxID=1233460 RepID=A0A3S1D3B9_9BACT|nr:hypothetical protein [Chitinophaga solisilvae]